MKTVFCSYESVGPCVGPNIKYCNKTFISCSNKSAIYLQEHVMYEHYSSDYESVGPV